MTLRQQSTKDPSLEKRLNAYSRQARSRPSSGTVYRTMKYGALASIVPLAVSVGDASAQATLSCFDLYPGSTINLSTRNGTANPSEVPFFVTDPFFIKLGSLAMWGAAPNSALVIVPYTTGVLLWLPVVDSTRFVYRQSASFSFAFPGPSVDYYGGLCAYSTSPVGPFCPPAGRGFMPIGTVEGPGFIELEVLSYGGGQASVVLSQLQFGEPPAHAGDCPLILPVELVSFDAISDGGHPVLSWETASELNNAGFEIQRASTGDAFAKVGFVDGRGSTDQSQTYTFIDESAQPNTLYRYRLRQIDLDGTTSFSSVVEVFTEIPDVVAVSQVYPNPVNGRGARVDVNLAESEEAVLEVYDVRGALVSSTVRALSRGQNRLRLETEGLARGSHFAKIQVGERVEYRSFVVAE